METKHYIFPEDQFDPDTVPTPWFDYINMFAREKRAELFSLAHESMIRWIIETWSRFDDEDRAYVLKMLYWTGIPPIRHEAMNFLAIVKAHYT